MEDNPRDYWVCPNDRQLALRAKLKTGWSVKTNTFDRYTKQQGINDVEQETIVQVIKRAEVIDNMEQERVGRLVEKLENMKKNAMGNGQNQCILCGDEFGLLGASALCCNDCKKAVCTKCGVDTSCTPKEAVWLCKICSETRETWKKSGAWFFKGLPKYILPGRKRIGKYNHGNRYDAQGGCSPSQSTHMYTTWARRGHITDSSGPESEESSDDDPAIRMSRRSKPVRDFDNSSCVSDVEYQNSRSGSVRSTTGSIQSSYSGSHQDLQRRLEEEASRSHSSHSRQGSYRSIKIADNHEGSVDNTIDGTFEKPDKRTKLNGDENFQASGGEQSFQKSITEPTPQPLPRTKLLQEDQPCKINNANFIKDPHAKFSESVGLSRKLFLNSAIVSKSTGDLFEKFDGHSVSQSSKIKNTNFIRDHFSRKSGFFGIVKKNSTVTEPRSETEASPKQIPKDLDPKVVPENEPVGTNNPSLMKSLYTKPSNLFVFSKKNTETKEDDATVAEPSDIQNRMRGARKSSILGFGRNESESTENSVELNDCQSNAEANKPGSANFIRDLYTRKSGILGFGKRDNDNNEKKVPTVEPTIKSDSQTDDPTDSNFFKGLYPRQSGIFGFQKKDGGKDESESNDQSNIGDGNLTEGGTSFLKGIYSKQSGILGLRKKDGEINSDSNKDEKTDVGDNNVHFIKDLYSRQSGIFSFGKKNTEVDCQNKNESESEVQNDSEEQKTSNGAKVASNVSPNEPTSPTNFIKDFYSRKSGLFGFGKKKTEIDTNNETVLEPEQQTDTQKSVTEEAEASGAVDVALESDCELDVQEGLSDKKVAKSSKQKKSRLFKLRKKKFEEVKKSKTLLELALEGGAETEKETMRACSKTTRPNSNYKIKQRQIYR